MSTCAVRWGSGSRRFSCAHSNAGQTEGVSFSVTQAQDMARQHDGHMHPRWENLQAVGRRAEELAESAGLSDWVVVAAWVHDIGYAPEIATRGFHPLDGARFLAEQGVGPEIVRLVA